MTSLTLAEKLIYGRVKKAAIVWILLLRLDPQPVNESLAAEILQIDRSTARGYLRTLNELLIITRLGRYEGYILTDSGRQLALPLELRRLQERAREEIPPSSPINNKDLKDSKDLKTSLLLIKGEGGNSPFEGGIPPQTPPQTGISIDQQIDQILAAEPAKQAILEALLYCRIALNWKTIALLYNDELTVAEIKAQFEFLKEKGLENDTGILITNLLAKYKPRGADFDPDTGHPLACNCYKCIGSRNRRVIEGTIAHADKYHEWND